MPSSALKLIQGAQNRALIYRFTISYSIIMTVVSIVSIIIGAVFHNQCAIESRISIYLIVEGVTVAVVYSIGLSVVSTFLNNIKINFSSFICSREWTNSLKRTLIQKVLDFLWCSLWFYSSYISLQ
jgi:hypothetical protein